MPNVTPDQLEPNVLTIDKVMNDNSASAWLKRQVNAVENRNPDQALSEVELLLSILKQLEGKTFWLKDAIRDALEEESETCISDAIILQVLVENKARGMFQPPS